MFPNFLLLCIISSWTPDVTTLSLDRDTLKDTVTVWLKVEGLVLDSARRHCNTNHFVKTFIVKNWWIFEMCFKLKLEESLCLLFKFCCLIVRWSVLEWPLYSLFLQVWQYLCCVVLVSLDCNAKPFELSIKTVEVNKQLICSHVHEDYCI